MASSSPSPQPARLRKLSHDKYTVAWISPLPVEQIAAIKMLDEEHQPLSQPLRATAGNTPAATVVGQMMITFPNLLFGLLVGIGGGVPCRTESGWIRLGDVVVGKPTGVDSGTIRYDHGKALATGVFQRVGSLPPPSPALLNAAQALDIHRNMVDVDPVLTNLARIQVTQRRLRRFAYPGASNDRLYRPEYVHLRSGSSCEECRCDASQRILTPADVNDNDEDGIHGPSIVVHRGTIASGDQVMKDAMLRDKLAGQYSVLCFEMEAAGALHSLPFLVVRGISDYCDSHKNDDWHGFAAATAAAYARQLFFHLPFSIVERNAPFSESQSDGEDDWKDDEEEEPLLEGEVEGGINENSDDLLPSVTDTIGLGEPLYKTLLEVPRGPGILGSARYPEPLPLPPRTEADESLPPVSVENAQVESHWRELHIEQKNAEAEALARSVQQKRLLQHGPDHELTLQSQNWLGLSCLSQNKEKEAMSWFRETTSASNQAGGGQHGEKMFALFMCGKVSYELCNHLDAEKSLRRVLEEAGKEYWWARDAEFHLAKTLWRLGTWVDAESAFRAYLKKRKDADVRDRFDLEAENLLGVTLLQLKRFDESEYLLREALGRISERCGSDFSVIDNFRGTLGHVLMGLGRTEEAKEIFITVSKGVSARPLENDEEVLDSQYHLGLTLAKLKLHQEAEHIFRKVVDGFSVRYGSTHSHTLDAQYYLGFSLRKLGRHDMAETYLRRAVQGYRSNNDDGPRKLASKTEACYELGSCLFELKRYEEAERSFGEAVEEAKRKLGEGHINTLTYQYWVGAALMEQRKYAEAEKVYRETLTLQSEESPLKAWCMLELGQALFKQDSCSGDAMLYTEAALIKRRDTLGPTHVLTSMALALKGDIAYAQGRLRDAEEAFETVANHRRENLGKDSIDTLAVLDLLGRVLYKQRKYSKAKKVFLDVLRSRKQRLGKSHPLTIQSKRRYNKAKDKDHS